MPVRKCTPFWRKFCSAQNLVIKLGLVCAIGMNGKGTLKPEPSSQVSVCFILTAVIYGCLETIAAIYPHNGLLELSAKCVSRFLSASNLNLKYIGIYSVFISIYVYHVVTVNASSYNGHLYSVLPGVKILTSLVAINPRYALEHQSTVLDCLEHSDASIRTKVCYLCIR